MTSSPTTTASPTENWDKKLKEIQSEENYQKLSPEEKAKIEEQEHQKYQQDKDKLKAELYGDLGSSGKPDQKESKSSYESEKYVQSAELKDIEMALLFNDTPTTDKGSSENKPNEFENPEKMKKFMKVFDDSAKAIFKKQEFKFSTFSFNQSGNQVEQTCKISKIIDHSANDNNLDIDHVSNRLSNKKAKPQNIGLVIDIGKISPENPSLQNITMEIPMVDLLNVEASSFNELISAKVRDYTNTILCAMVIYDQTNKSSSSKPVEDPKDKSVKPKSSDRQPVRSDLNKIGINEIQQGGGTALNSNSNLEQGITSTVSFRCNNGSVWGTFDSSKSNNSHNELAEILAGKSSGEK